MPLTRRHFLTISAAAWAVPSHANGTPVVAAAASLRFVLPALAEAYAKAHGVQLRLTYGSSGTLAQQIRNGAPFDLFLSADERYVLDLEKDGTIPDAGALYALGRLAIAAPNGSDLPVDPQLDGLRAELETGGVARFAIANPSHAPYGMRAKEALVHRGLWAALQPVLVFGENVAQAAQFAISGNADGGLIAGSLAVSGPMAARSRHALIPAEWHAPLAHRMALTHGAQEAARGFYAFLQSQEGLAILTAHGFGAPGDGQAPTPHDSLRPKAGDG